MKKILIIIATIFLLLAWKTFADFSDIWKEHWYYKAINYARENNIINGYNDWTFKPKKNISFLEFAKIIIIWLWRKDELKNEEWFWKYWKYLSDEKAIPISFATVNTEITRWDVVEIIWRLKENIKNKQYFVFNYNECFCTPAGQSYWYYLNSKCQPKCCNGLIETNKQTIDNLCLPSSGWALCIPCGNKICEKDLGETNCNCPKDCNK